MKSSPTFIRNVEPSDAAGFGVNVPKNVELSLSFLGKWSAVLRKIILGGLAFSRNTVERVLAKRPTRGFPKT